ncbi:MAG: ABC transporter substrate-binding protein [Candidatus Binatia bacterium]
MADLKFQIDLKFAIRNSEERAAFSRQNTKAAWLRMLVFCALSLFLAPSAHGAGWEDEWKKTLAAAKAEGRVAVSIPPGDTWRQAVIKFQDFFPDIRIEVSGQSAPDYIPRLRQERRAGLYTVDVRMGGARTNHQLIPEGVYAPLRPIIISPEALDDKKWLGGFAGGFSDQEKKYSYMYFAYLTEALYVNRDVVPETEFLTAADLLSPKWKGKIAMRDPRVIGAGNASMVLLRKNLGEEFVRRLLLTQGVVFSQDYRQVAEWVVRGQYPIGIGLSDTHLSQFQKEGVGLNVKSLILPETTAVNSGFGAVALLDRAPHPNAAKVFINWVLSRAGQATIAPAVRVNSRRLDVVVVEPPTRVSEEQFKTWFHVSRQENEKLADKALKMAKTILK